MATKTLPWTGRTPCSCTVPQPAGRRTQNGISYDPCMVCGKPCPLTKEQAEGRAVQRRRNDDLRRK